MGAAPAWRRRPPDTTASERSRARTLLGRALRTAALAAGEIRSLPLRGFQLGPANGQIDRFPRSSRPDGKERREPERSLLDVNEHRKRSRDEASRDGSAARTIDLSVRGPLARAGRRRPGALLRAALRRPQGLDRYLPRRPPPRLGRGRAPHRAELPARRAAPAGRARRKT